MRTALLMVFCSALHAQIFRAALERSATAEFAAGDRQPLNQHGLRFDGGAQFPPNAQLTYDARGNIYAEQGTVSFWWRPDEPPGRLAFPLFQVSYEQHSTWDYNFLRIQWTGTQLSARIRDRNLQFHMASATACAFTWTGSWLRGRRGRSNWTRGWTSLPSSIVP